MTGIWLLSLIYRYAMNDLTIYVFFLFASNNRTPDVGEVVPLIVWTSVVVILVLCAIYLAKRIKNSRNDQAVSLHEIYRQFDQAWEEGELSEEEYRQIRRELSEKIISVEKNENQNQ